MRWLGNAAVDRHANAVRCARGLHVWVRAFVLSVPLLCGVVLPGGTTAQAADDSRQAAALRYFSDVTLQDQDGRPVRFYSDVLAGKTLVVHSFFGDCTGVCPVILQKLRALQDTLGDRLGRTVFIVSVSVDPARDSPSRLKALARSLGAKPGWMFLTGTPPHLEQALFKLGFATLTREAHNPTLIVGHEPAGNWQKLAASSTVVTLVTQLEDVAAVQ